MFISPWGIVFWFLIWSWPLPSRSSCESIFHWNGFFPYFVKSTRGILVKRVRKLHRQVTHELIIVHLQLTYFHKYCVVLKLPILWPRSLSSKVMRWIWFLFARDLWVVSIIYLITLDLCWPCSVSRSFINIWHIRWTQVTQQKIAERNSPSSEIAGGGLHCFCALSHIHHWIWTLKRNSITNESPVVESGASDASLYLKL